MELGEKLKLLADAAKYDVSCSSSGGSRKNKGGIGNSAPSGICHSYSADGRCISLLKILLTNRCIYRCAYCPNSREEGGEKASFTPREVADLTLSFYKRNYIEGLFLSSGIEHSIDETMEHLIEVARILREEEHFYGYIHMKAIPGADPALVDEMASLVDRMSINVEIADRDGLRRLAPQKDYPSILGPMERLNHGILERKASRLPVVKNPYLPAGQSSQMIVGALGEDDRMILNRSASLYKDYNLKRVFYSAFVPVVHSPLLKGITKVPLLREHRLYQADWLMRFYRFSTDEIVNDRQPNLDPDVDPKMQYALLHLHEFPVEINRANYNMLLRIPGIGPTYAKRIISARKLAPLCYDDLKLLKISTKKARHFITVGGKYFGMYFSDAGDLRAKLLGSTAAGQLSFL